MKFILSFAAGIAAALAIASLAGRRIEEAVSELATVDLNTCSRVSLMSLGLSDDDADRVIDKRPYRNKLDLLSQLIVPEETYVLIKERIGVDTDRAREGVRVAG